MLTERIEAKHLEDVVNLHANVLSWSISGQLGRPFIETLYRALFDTSGFFGFVCYGEKRELLGFMTATTNFAEVRKAITPIYKAHSLRLLANCCTEPFNLIAVAESRILIPRFYEKHRLSGEALSIVTDTTQKSVQPMVAYLLVKKVKGEFRSRGISRFGTQVLSRNRLIEGPFFEAVGGKLMANLWAHRLYIFDLTAAA